MRFTIKRKTSSSPHSISFKKLACFAGGLLIIGLVVVGRSSFILLDELQEHKVLTLDENNHNLKNNKSATEEENNTNITKERNEKYPTIEDHDVKENIKNNFALYGAGRIWDSLLKEGSNLMKKETNKLLVAMEVGMHSAKQCIDAATFGFHAFCFEPSPRNIQRCEADVDKVKNDPSRQDIYERIHLYNAAAGSKSGEMVEFSASGSTGDHVGDFDMWNMKEGGNDDLPLNKRSELVKVPTISLDDVIHEKLPSLTSDGVFLMKIDTQGFEPSVFSGLKQSIAEKKVTYILFEFWPKGMDLLSGRQDQCSTSVEILRTLAQSGYTLYALSVEAHPRAPKEATTVMKRLNERPLDDFMKYCQWFLKMEDRFPSEEYHMGYWSDFLAVVPGHDISQITI